MQKQTKTGAAASKAEAAKARKIAEEVKRKVIEAREKEDKYWQEAEGTKSRCAMKRQEEAKKREEAAARKAEARRLAEEEEKELEKNLKKTHKKVKATEAELRRRREAEQAAIPKKVEEVKRRKSHTTTEKEYERTVLVKNTNRDYSVIDASTIEEAIAQMTNPTTTFKAFEKAELLRLKEEKPGLTVAQYKDKVSKLWKRSHLNPVNQTADQWKQSAGD